MAYASYEYYTKQYYGSAISEDEWERLSKAATDAVNRATFYRMDGWPDEKILDVVRDAVCAVAELIQQREVEEARGITSENNDGYSVSYRDSGTRDFFRNELWATIKGYLGHTGLMFRGGNRYGKCRP